MRTIQPNGDERDAQYWLGIRTQPQPYCETCGNIPEHCECERDEEDNEHA